MIGQLPHVFHRQYYIVLLSQTQDSLHRILLGGERENVLHWKMRDFKEIEQPRRKCKKRYIRTNTCSYFLIFLDPQLFHLPETQDGAGLLLLEFPMLIHFMFRQAYKNTFVPFSCSTFHPSVPEVKFVFYLNE